MNVSQRYSLRTSALLLPQSFSHIIKITRASYLNINYNIYGARGGGINGDGGGREGSGKNRVRAPRVTFLTLIISVEKKYIYSHKKKEQQPRLCSRILYRFRRDVREIGIGCPSRLFPFTSKIRRINRKTNIFRRDTSNKFPPPRPACPV